jgi:peptide-methionine (R)-S-oxide reductase
VTGEFNPSAAIMRITRRQALRAGTALAAIGILGRAVRAAEGTFEITRSESEWRALLTPGQYAVLRGEATERPGSSPLYGEHRSGLFHCAGCEAPLFSSSAKFDSGTGWPSFWQPLDGAVGTRVDKRFGMVRTEVHCARCGGHLGHVFDDGPRPTGLRYCINGLALAFMPGHG